MPKKTKNKAFDWVKRCAESNGISHMVPEKLQDRAEKLLEEAQILTEARKALNRREADFTIMRDNFWYDVRKALEANGVKDAFEKNAIDFDADAKKDGFLVANLFNENHGRPMGIPR